MKLTGAILLILAILLTHKADAQPKMMYRLQAQYLHTLKDQTKINNPWGMGIALQLFYTRFAKWAPLAQLSSTIYLANTKVFIFDSVFGEYNRVETLSSLLAGAQIKLIDNLHAIVIAGPSLINGKWYASVQPGFKLYFNQNKKWAIGGFYNFVFNRVNPTKGHFMSAGVGISVKL
jgi:hypothetical protein